MEVYFSQLWRLEVGDQVAGSDKDPPPSLQMGALALCAHVGKGESALVSLPFIRALIPRHGPTRQPHLTSSPPRGPTSKQHHTGVRVSTQDSGGGIQFSLQQKLLWVSPAHRAAGEGPCSFRLAPSRPVRP